MTDLDFKKLLKNCMKSTEFCTLATVDSELGVWSNPVYFSWDGKFNIYFMSLPKSRHMKSLENDPRIAVSIFNSSQSTFDDITGIQLRGNAKVLNSLEEITDACNANYGRKYPDAGIDKKGKTPSSFLDYKWKFVKITPEEIYYFDTSLFDEETQGRQLIPKEFYAG